MGGDAPLDLQDMLFELFCIEQYPDEGGVNTISAKDFNDNLPACIVIAEEFEDHIAYQVLGYLMMKAGAVIPKDLKARMILAGEKDEWAEEENERLQVMRRFVSILSKYEDKKIDTSLIDDQGLFAKMFS